jgi:hypothetical protein
MGDVIVDLQDGDVYDENEQRQLCDAYLRACLETLYQKQGSYC